MKKVFFSALIGAMMVSSSVFAQQTFSIGPRVGVNLSDVRSDPSVNTSFKPGLAAGLYFIYSISSTFGINVEAMYSEKGYKLSYPGGKSILNNQYIELPVLARFFMVKTGKIKPSVVFGPAFAYRLKTTDQEIEPKKLDKVEVTTRITDTDVSVHAGLGLSIDMNGQWLNFDARYIHGISNTSTVSDRRNSTIQLTVGYAFGL